MALSTDELSEIMRLYGPGQRGTRAFDTIMPPYGYGATRRDLPDDESAEDWPPTVEEFRAKFGRDPVTDSEVEFYYGPMDDLIDREDKPSIIPQEENIGSIINQEMAQGQGRDWDVRTPPPLPMIPNPAPIAPHNPRPPGGGPYQIQPGQRIGDIIEQYGPRTAQYRGPVIPQEEFDRREDEALRQGTRPQEYPPVSGSYAPPSRPGDPEFERMMREALEEEEKAMR